MRDDEFERLYERLAPGLFGFLAYRTGDRALAEDVVADTFERVLRARRRFDPRRGGRGKSWVYSIALNCLSDQMRRRQAEQRAVDRVEVGLPPDDLENVHDRDQLGLALRSLSDVEREAIALRFGGDLTVPEIAELTGEPLTTVEGRVYRALRKLRDVLDQTP